ncbi:MAG: hypothetical protein A2V70_11390 [Planctomycetes bacterium RBG_13_63_9]|nr:MAG: hypothetical protein A2V70_11390 [Planctomycetes bacterium RBG_13_63_9]
MSGTLGTIGFIANREEPSESAIKARSEVFRDSKHIITFLDDFDFAQMVHIKRLGALPETYLQRRIEDFLLAF